MTGFNDLQVLKFLNMMKTLPDTFSKTIVNIMFRDK